MGYQAERDEYMAIMAREGLALDKARRLLSLTQTAHRLAVARCNGDWPADNGERPSVACPECGCGWVPSTIKGGKCPDCRNEAAIRALLEGTGFEPICAGDPRGAVVKVKAPSGHSNSWGGEGICVPVRER